MTKDEQARARLVEIAEEQLRYWTTETALRHNVEKVRRRAGFKNPSKGHWCAAGLTAAMEDAGLVVPAPGTPARRGAVALLDWMVYAPGAAHGHVVAMAHDKPAACLGSEVWKHYKPGDVIAWLQNRPPAEWRYISGATMLHAFATNISGNSMCGNVFRKGTYTGERGRKFNRCSSCVWETRKGHVALIVSVDDESITTVGWNEGNAPGRVMKRRLWRDPERIANAEHGPAGGRGLVPRSSTVLYRKPTGMLYGIARPVAR